MTSLAGHLMAVLLHRDEAFACFILIMDDLLEGLVLCGVTRPATQLVLAVLSSRFHGALLRHMKRRLLEHRLVCYLGALPKRLRADFEGVVMLEADLAAWLACHAALQGSLLDLVFTHLFHDRRVLREPDHGVRLADSGARLVVDRWY